MDGARRLGRNAMILSVVAILGGIAIIAAAIALNWGCELHGTPKTTQFKFEMTLLFLKTQV